MTTIKVEGLKKHFKANKQTVNALQNVCLDIADVQIFGLLGPNGAGKTTLLRILTTLLKPDAGKAVVAGHDIAASPKEVRKVIGYVSQQGGSEATATGRENLIFQAQLYGLGIKDARKRVAQLLESFDIESIADRIVATYSGGQKRRLDLAMSIVHEPQLLFLDEPTVGLDPQSRIRVWEEIKGLHEQGTTIILTTHYLNEADSLCDQIAIIDYGKIVVEGTPEGLKRKIAGDIIWLGLSSEHSQELQKVLSEKAFVRNIVQEQDMLRLIVDEGESALPVLLKIMNQHDLVLQNIRLERPSLDDVFLKQTGRSLRESPVI